LVFVWLVAGPASASRFEFVLKPLEQLTFAGGVCLSANSRVSARECEVHFRARGRKTRTFFQLLDCSLNLTKVQQDAAEHISGWKHVGRELHCFFRERQRGVEFVTFHVLERHLHHRWLVQWRYFQLSLELF